MQNTHESWLRKVEEGTKVRTLNPHDVYAGHLLTVTKVIEDATIPMDGWVEFKVGKKKAGGSRLWWIYEYCELVE